MPDGGYVIPGMSNSYTYSTDSMQMLLIRTDSLGYSGCHEQRVHPIVGTAPYTAQTLPFTQSRGMIVNDVNLTVQPWNILADDACLHIGIASPLAEDETLLSVFPNPAKNYFSVHTSLRKGELEIYNVLGAKIYSEKLKSEPVYLNQGAGIYFVRVYDGEKVFTQKLVID
jgi:hypothetical protein